MNIVADEQQPLLTPNSEDAEYGLFVKQDEVILDFEDGDPENPREWTARFKWCIVLLLASMAFTVTFTCIGVVPVASRIVYELSGDSDPSSSTSALLVTIWELGEAAGPLLIAPLSEVFGRYAVMNGCNIAFILSTFLAATSQSTKLFIAARMLTGLTVASNVLNPAIIGDMYESEKRGSAMSLVMLAPLIGGAVGPAISGTIAQTLGWREILYIAAGLAVCCEVLFLTCFRETYKMCILRKRAAKLLRDSGEFAGMDRGKSRHENMMKLWHSITRPFAVFFGSEVLLLLSLFGSVAFSYFYVMSISLPNILQEVYGFTPAQTGSAFISFSVGSFCSVLLCNFSLDRIYIRLRSPSDARGKPEYRLPMAIIGAVFLPLAVTAYGWIAQFRLPVPLLLLSVALLGFTLLLTIIPLSAYVVDACGIYSASAMTGVIMTRCLMGTFLPLTTGPLAENLGYGWGFSCLGALSLSLAVVPVLILRYGEKWRQRSEVTRDV
ncbi:MFS general substrate transporter [Lentithecium fluviatile CBS 122367]|uniref:MFS general substrate transporter n=1 Tax=Lentithecium fluviatile CBS 122367 TaxID=1168545 RepID=A0A6G1IUQ2_9PLEO|nr:MFS general substrate transporter [Lentithecium fluviatile CBS 122367]